MYLYMYLYIYGCKVVRDVKDDPLARFFWNLEVFRFSVAGAMCILGGDAAWKEKSSDCSRTAELG